MPHTRYEQHGSLKQKCHTHRGRQMQWAIVSPYTDPCGLRADVSSPTRDDRANTDDQHRSERCEQTDRDVEIENRRNEEHAQDENRARRNDAGCELAPSGANDSAASLPLTPPTNQGA